MGILNKTKKEKKQEEKKQEIREEAIQPSKSGFQRKFTLLVRQAWITEKAGDLGALGKYIFIVDRKINKPEVKKAVEAIYNVKVEDVNVVNIKGKAKRLGRSLGRTSAVKKVIVTLKKGQKIDIMPT